ncbi:restriction endonuclease subunit S [Microbacterium esteraromaticum]|uniref:restriction endonuclease subunit S n=1 Tax=Microbacterium esteraromaticum TaxID=57043 RepID=UPI002367FC46|nr:restriction endonuclease subunit S [Microbacterium esteraromaticum]WDH78809.1 restriction endonuclease subunit S [Microbacterium esteraromaticum]
MTPVGWDLTTWGEVVELRYGKALRDYRDGRGSVAVYGTNGPVGFTDVHQTKGPGVVVGRKGAYRGVHYAAQDFWVIDTAFYIAPKRPLDMRWAYYSLQLADINGLDSGSAIPSTTRESFAGLRAHVPPLPEQQAIAEVLGALDDKITANTALAATAAAVARLELRAAVRDDARELTVDEASVVLVRGITPRYLPDGEGTRVLNQKCVRDQVVSLGPSRWTDDSKVRAEKVLAVGDILVNSTGQGTLGRVARWTLPGQATVDSHITIVRPDPNVSDPTVIGQAVLAIEADIEALGEGSTGQTELSRVELGRARIRVPSGERANRVGQTLRALAASQDAVRAENATLAATRDALLPKLMSGKLRVRDAQKVAQEAGL